MDTKIDVSSQVSVERIDHQCSCCGQPDPKQTRVKVGLILTPDQAATLMDLCYKIAGSPEGMRGLFSGATTGNLLDQLHKVGIERNFKAGNARVCFED